MNSTASAPKCAACKTAAATRPPAERQQEYQQLLHTILDSSTPQALAADLVAFAEGVLSDSLSIVLSRQLITYFVAEFRKVQDAATRIDVGNKLVDLIAPSVVLYEAEDVQLKEIIASAYEHEEDFQASARVLKTIPLESSQRTVTDNDKARVWVRIVRCYLEEDDPANASTYLNRAKGVLYAVTDDETLLHFQLSQARILDSQRAFLDASQVYHALSGSPVVDEDERLRALSAAMVCAVLAPAGPQRAATLARLYHDERAPHVAEFAMLEKMFLDRLLAPDEVRDFAQRLRPHQLAKTADGVTVLDKAVLEHNLLAASRLYANIGFDQLGELLGVVPDRAESYAAKMLQQGRLAGYIDQIDRLVFFEGDATGETTSPHAQTVFGKELRKWDANVQGLAEDVERIAAMVQNKHPVRFGAVPLTC